MTLPAALTRVEGPNLVFRLICHDDAEYVYGMRTDPAYNTHLSEVHGTAQDQRRWIESYKEREADRQELYYVIERKDSIRCGLVRLYNIGRDSFTWGSWILDNNKTPKAALESAVLVYMVAFDTLAIPKAEFEVRSDNSNTLGFHRRFGATETHATQKNRYFTYSSSSFDTDRARYLAILKKDYEE